jgi:hypothetical protein
MFPSQATAEVHLTSGQAIEAWEKLPGERRVAYYDPRNAAQRARFEQLRTEVVAELHRRGLDQLAQGVEGDNLALAFTPSVPADVLPDLQEMLDLGLPVAVFVGPPRR